MRFDLVAATKTTAAAERHPRESGDLPVKKRDEMPEPRLTGRAGK